MKRAGSLVSRAPLCAGVVALSGCFSYVEVPVEAAPIGAEYRVLLTRRRLEELRDLDDGGLPDSGPPQVHGVLVERDASEISLRLPIASRQVGFHQAEIDRQIRVALADVVQVERQRLDRGRTALAVAGLAALGGGVVFTILDGARFWENSPEPPPPDALRSQLAGFSVP